MSYERLFTVGELAKKCGVTVRTLQFYDRKGLLTPSRHSDGGRRLYGVDDLLRLQQILFYKGFGFSLDEIRDRLMSIESAQDFAEMLQKQKSIMEKQIEYLTQTVSLMNKTIVEINNSEDIPINMVIAMLIATKQDIFFSFVMKGFEQEDLVSLISTSEANKDGVENKNWVDLLMRLKELHQIGVNPTGPEGEQLAKDWWDRVMHLTGGDPDLISTVLKAGENLSEWPDDVRDVKIAIQDFLSPALGNYFIKKGITLPGIEGFEMEGEE